MSVLERVREAETGNGCGVDDGVRRRELIRRSRERLKGDLLDRLGLETVAGMLEGGDAPRARAELTVALEAIMNSKDYEGLPTDLRPVIVGQVVDEVCGLGPIQRLLDDPEVTEVMVNGPDALFYEKGGSLHEADAAFDSAEQVAVVIDRILAPLGRRLDRTSPLVDARLANGDRVNAVAQPAAVNGPLLTIRKFSRKARSLDELVGMGSLPGWYAQLLRWAVLLRRSIAVAGGTGSGKTTLLNALSREIPPGERIVTIEDSAELRFDAHPNVVSLEAQEASIEGTGEVTIRRLVKNSLRMRPDRIVVGEVRGEEAIDMLQAMNTGHSGSLTTLHAGSAQEAMLRLVLMARFGMDLPPELIEEQIATAIDLIVMSGRLADGSRAITSLDEVRRGPTGGVERRECVSFDAASREWRLVAEPLFVARAVEEGRLEAWEVEEWRRCC